MKLNITTVRRNAYTEYLLGLQRQAETAMHRIKVSYSIHDYDLCRIICDDLSRIMANLRDVENKLADLE